LFTKVSDDPDVSGWGLEHTMRVARSGDDPPQWAVQLLARLGELTFQRGTPFFGGRIELPNAPEGCPPAVAWIDDPALEPTRSPFGLVRFVATVGISSKALEAIRESSTAEYLDGVRRQNPLLVSGRIGLEWT
jgi:Suppressor of fused protein (SUFU)